MFSLFPSVPNFMESILCRRIMRHEHGVGKGYNTSMDTTTGLTFLIERTHGCLIAARCCMLSEVRPGQSTSIHEPAFLNPTGDRQPSFG